MGNPGNPLASLPRGHGGAGLRTEAVLSLDDDIVAPCSVLDALFEVCALLLRCGTARAPPVAGTDSMFVGVGVGVQEVQWMTVAM